MVIFWYYRPVRGGEGSIEPVWLLPHPLNAISGRSSVLGGGANMCFSRAACYLYVECVIHGSSRLRSEFSFL